MMSDPRTLTIHFAQTHQPWVVPYSQAVMESGVPHILATHSALHAMKSLGKLATVFEALDHSEEPITEEQTETVRAASADLMTTALRFANLFQFDLAKALVERVEEKNKVDYPDWAGD